jgi:hypothetical protein
VTDDLTEGDVHALLTDLRDGLRRDGYDLEVLAATPRVRLAIRADADACEDCLVGKSLMTRYVVIALRDLSPDISEDDVELDYPAGSKAGA